MIGAYRSGNRGAVYVFEKPVSGWASGTETHKFTSPNPFNNGYFGAKVQVKGDELLIGAAREDSGKGRV